MNFTEIPLAAESNLTEITPTEKVQTDEEFSNIEKMAIGLSLLGGVIFGIIVGLIFYCKKHEQNRIVEDINPARILQNNVLNMNRTMRSPDEEFKEIYNIKLHDEKPAKTDKKEVPVIVMELPERHTSDESIPDLE